ncbi:hypothetical protein [Fulvivirga ligni]|uniref:hypothetical protein n=1 Tax=Fulvivirga ligni TaxID=2904246 RepID=UPI001F4543EB|nr:hypothetical protein [Fulvivirga ligni]UII18968.1 hypothetical protein LVD16_14075 [Fulvivirga ligni]
MYHIVLHCRPSINNHEFHGKVTGAYASILIDYKDYDGAINLATFYTQQSGWEFIELEDEYYIFDEKEDLPDDYQAYFDEVIEFGYSIIFNTYKG